jgi:hypothetical protein
VLGTLDDARGLSPTLQEVDQLRQVANSAVRDPNPNERRIGGMIVDHMDNWLNNLGPKDVVSAIRSRRPTSSPRREAYGGRRPRVASSKI